MPKAKKTSNRGTPRSSTTEDQTTETRRYLLLSGSHMETERDEEGNFAGTSTYEAGEIVESDRDLITIFGANRFKLVTDDIKTLPEGERASKADKDAAALDSINKISEEDAKKFKPNDPASKGAYRENAGYEQLPPRTELETTQDKRIREGKPVPENRGGGGGEVENKHTGAHDRKKEEE